MSDEIPIFPDTLRIRDTMLHDDLGGLGQRIYTTAGQGYKKQEYVRGDIVASLRTRVKELEDAIDNLWDAPHLHDDKRIVPRADLDKLRALRGEATPPSTS